MEHRDVLIRPARVGETQHLKAIGVRGWNTAYASFVRAENRESYLDSDFWSIDRLRMVLGDPTAINLVAEAGGQAVGFITVERHDDGRYEITRLYVDPDIRSRGIGGRLLSMVLEHLRQRQVDEVLVNAFGDNHAGRRFYECEGFELIEDTFTKIGDQVLSDVWYKLLLATIDH
jgi:ribosomal protein S18 acetylase RimI-like enzyme